MATWIDFEKIDIRVGTVVHAEEFKEAKVPAYKLKIDFGELGMKNSSAQATKNYTKEELIGKQVICVVNFPKKQIANFFSEVLTMGVYNNSKEDVILLQPEQKVENGKKIG